MIIGRRALVVLVIDALFHAVTFGKMTPFLFRGLSRGTQSGDVKFTRWEKNTAAVMVMASDGSPLIQSLLPLSQALMSVVVHRPLMTCGVQSRLGW